VDCRFAQLHQGLFADFRLRKLSLVDFPEVRNFMLRIYQDALIAAAEARGYTVTSSSMDLLFDLRNPLEHGLPQGYRFVNPESIDTGKLLRCGWKGFDHESEGAWDGKIDPGLRIKLSPNATPQYYVVIEDSCTGEYVCYAGMWWTEENALAYMEPLCTVPEHRHKGLAAAALSEMARRVRPLGAQWMTGGANEFYAKIGYESGVQWITYQKK
jgi:GNAT superfamily N-acetyltransferase